MDPPSSLTSQRAWVCRWSGRCAKGALRDLVCTRLEPCGARAQGDCAIVHHRAPQLRHLSKVLRRSGDPRSHNSRLANTRNQVQRSGHPSPGAASTSPQVRPSPGVDGRAAPGPERVLRRASWESGAGKGEGGRHVQRGHLSYPFPSATRTRPGPVPVTWGCECLRATTTRPGPVPVTLEGA